MFESLYSCEFWVIIVIVFILAFWIASRFNGNNDYEDSNCYTRSPREATVNYEEAIDKTRTNICYDMTPRIPVEIMRYNKDGDVNVNKNNINNINSYESYDHREPNTIYESVVPEIPDHIQNPNKRPESTKGPSEPRSKGERLCKAAVEKIYGVPFYSTWPKWLKSPKGYPMELDLYNEDLKLAIEYHGKQHYEYTPHFHRNGINDFYYQIEKDNRKLDLCDEKGVYVITVPYNIPDDKIEEFIRYYDPVAYANRLKRMSQIS